MSPAWHVQDNTAKAGRFTLPFALFAYPFYLWKRSPGKEGSHYDPACNLFAEGEGKLVSPTPCPGVSLTLGSHKGCKTITGHGV